MQRINILARQSRTIIPKCSIRRVELGQTFNVEKKKPLPLVRQIAKKCVFGVWQFLKLGVPKLPRYDYLYRGQKSKCTNTTYNIGFPGQISTILGRMSNKIQMPI